jgi:hypothetical protein
VMEAAALADRCARRLDRAYRALEEARARRRGWRALRRSNRRGGADARTERAREYAHAAMDYSAQFERLRELLTG